MKNNTVISEKMKFKVAIILVVILFAGPFLLNFGFYPEKSWDYFGRMAYELQFFFKNNFMMRLHDPWSCGGLDLLTNTQSHLFSVWSLGDLVFNPVLTPVLMWCFYGVLGFCFFYQVCRKMDLSESISLLTSFLWVSGSYFALRYVEGQAGFASLLVLPGILLLKWYGERLFFFKICFLFIVGFLLEGSFYTLVFGLYLAMFLLLSGFVTLDEGRRIWRTILNHKLFFVLGGLAVACVGFFRIYPAALSWQGKVASLENIYIPMQEVMKSLFWPLQNDSDAIVGLKPIAHPYLESYLIAFVEIGCYIGLLKLFLFGVAVQKKKTQVGILLGLLFIAWMGFGWLSELNPWSIHQNLPFSFLSIQSRTLVLFYLVFLLVMAKGISSLSSDRVKKIISVVLWVESLFVFGSVVISADWSGRLANYARPFQNTSLVKTVVDYQFPDQSGENINLARRSCDEPSQLGLITVFAATDKDYKGEAYFENQPEKSSAEILSVEPGKLSLNVKTDVPANLVVNQNYLYGWKSNVGEAYARKDGRLSIYLNQSYQGELILKYQPFYREWIYVFLFAGLLLLSLIILPKDSQYENKSSRAQK